MKSTIHINNIFLEDEKNIQPKLNLNTSNIFLKKCILFIIYITFVINIYNLRDKYKMYILIIYPIISYILHFYDTRLPILDNMLNGFYNIVCLFITPYYTYSRKQIIENPSSPYQLVGLLDDNPSKIHTTLHGIPVFGKIESIHTFNVPFDEIIICTSAASSSEMRRIVDHCKVLKKPYRTIPTVSELIDKKVSLNAVRDVSILDLLGRQEVNLNRSEISKYIFGKKVLVTGAGGSIGSEITRQVIKNNPKKVIILDSNEYALYAIKNEIELLDIGVSLYSILANVTNAKSHTK